MSAHTPGPWAVCVWPKNDYWTAGRTVYSTVEGSRVADTACLRNDSQAFADARLIAAAPDLLEALQFLMDEACKSVEYSDWPELQQYVSDSANAIAKATGEAA